MSKIIIGLVIIILIVVGWIAFIAGKESGEDKYGIALSDAEIYMEHGLYQLAIAEFSKALDIKENEKVRKEMVDAYEKRLKEDDDLIYAFQDVLNDYMKKYGYTDDNAEKLANLYIETNEPDEAYKVLKNAINSGIENAKLAEYAEQIRYSYELSTAEYDDFSPLSNGLYSVSANGIWKRIKADGNSLRGGAEYRYISQLNKNSIALFNGGEESRLINTSGVVYGIFKYPVFQAGIYSEELIGIMKDDKWNYYNSFAEKQFGDYDFGGNFINGKTAVLQNGKWFIIDNKGETQGDKKFDDLVLSSTGVHITNNVIIASEDGKYRFYNESLESIGDFSCDYIDKNTNDGLLAFKQGEKWGFVDITGKVVIEPQYDEAKSFSNGLAGVCVDGRWGFINKGNKVVIEPMFSDVDYFNSSGVCMVSSPSPDRTGVYWKTLKLNIGIVGD
jgi:hypothetical protein